MAKFNINDQESKNILDFEKESEDIVISDNDLESSFVTRVAKVEDSSDISEKKRYFLYAGNFGGLAGLNTAVYVLHNRYHDKFYIGQTINLQSRLNSHFQALDKGIHRNEELQKDFNEIREKKLDHKKEFYGSIIYRKLEERVFSKDDILRIIQLLVKIEQAEIKNYVESGKPVYNLSELISKPFLVDGVYYSGLEKYRQSVGYRISTFQVRVNLSDPKMPKWKNLREKDKEEILPSSLSTVDQPIDFTNPYDGSIKRLNSQSECERFIKTNFLEEQLNEFRYKFKIPISRKRIATACRTGNCQYLKFSDI